MIVPTTSIRPARPLLRLFSTTNRLQANRAFVYSQNGSPKEVLTALTYPSLSPPPPGTLNLRYLLSPINPADLNVIEGVYPSKPSPSSFPNLSSQVFVAGNEGLAEIKDVGSGVDGLQVGDWVVATKQQVGTWASARNVQASEVLKIPRTDGLSEVNAATITVNPATAYNMLTDFVDLQPGSWVIQNGANSAVGQAVIHIAKARGLKTINLVRDRPDIDVLKQELQSMGATHVLTYEELEDKKSLKAKIQAWTGGDEIRLALNCVGGNSTTRMAGLLGQDAHIVTYGAMARAPLSLGASLFIFKNLTSHGFWVSRWYTQHGKEDRERMMSELVALMSEGKLAEPKHEILTIRREQSDEEATQAVRAVLDKMLSGQSRSKILLRIEEPNE
ncbi:NAD(P)-binding protein [Artomyces pyxidatus]|uniref:NAD(P)-binding protein n=1 Tax=Artomyces pyxidatus TaxID=48021 RepID=A0ACB8T9L6_9AGAM|nr:NAD(P)-binding protein [Artomyces pyxidatus]